MLSIEMYFSGLDSLAAETKHVFMSLILAVIKLVQLSQASCSGIL